MKKTIIAVSGTANVGKSMTLARLGRQLVAVGATTATNVSGKDYNANFTYKTKTIGIQTYGDATRLVKNGLDGFLTMNCDIIAIASKGYGGTVKEIEKFANTNGYRVIWTKPYCVWDGSISDNDIKDYSASHLKFMLDDIISTIL